MPTYQTTCSSLRTTFQTSRICRSSSLGTRRSCRSTCSSALITCRSSLATCSSCLITRSSRSTTCRFALKTSDFSKITCSFALWIPSAIVKATLILERGRPSFGPIVRIQPLVGIMECSQTAFHALVRVILSQPVRFHGNPALWPSIFCL